MKIRKRKDIWKLYNLRKGSGRYLIADMKPEDFDRVVKQNSGAVLKIEDLEIYFLRTPVIPIVVYRGLEKKKKLPF